MICNVNIVFLCFIVFIIFLFAASVQSVWSCENTEEVKSLGLQLKNRLPIQQATKNCTPQIVFFVVRILTLWRILIYSRYRRKWHLWSRCVIFISFHLLFRQIPIPCLLVIICNVKPQVAFYLPQTGIPSFLKMRNVNAITHYVSLTWRNK